MKGINRQIIGFIVGAIFLALVLFVIAYLLSAVSSAQIRLNNIKFMGWFMNGFVEAWNKGKWADTVPASLESDGNYKYMIAFVPNDTAKDINESMVCNDYRTKNCLKASDSFSTCIAPDSLCLCLFKLPTKKSSENMWSIIAMIIYVPEVPENSGLIIRGSSWTWSKWGNNLSSMISDSLSNGNGEIVTCQNLVFKGYAYEGSNGKTEFPYIEKNGDSNQKIFGILSDYRSGFEIHKKDKILNLTEATS